MCVFLVLALYLRQAQSIYEILLKLLLEAVAKQQTLIMKSIAL